MTRLLLILTLIVATAAHAFEVPPQTGHVNDTAGLVPVETSRWLEAELARIAREQRLEVAVLTVRNLAGDTPESAAQPYFEVAPAEKVAPKVSFESAAAPRT